MSEPGLTAELDEAEAIVMGHAETVMTEWGVRYDDLSETAAILGAGPEGERCARREVACWPESATLVRRTVTYGPWEEAPGEQRAETGDPGSAGEAQPG